MIMGIMRWRRLWKQGLAGSREFTFGACQNAQLALRVMGAFALYALSGLVGWCTYRHICNV